MILMKQKAPPPKKREVKKKPPNPKAQKATKKDFDRIESFAPGHDELAELVRTAGTRMPGKFGDGGLVRDPAEDPAMRFVLKKKQPPQKAAPAPSPTRAPSPATTAPRTVSVSSVPKKDVAITRAVVPAVDRSKALLFRAT